MAKGASDRVDDTRGIWLGCVAAFALAVALASVPHTVQAGDAGEFSTVLLKGGVAHPSGYPFMRLLGPLARAFAALGVPAAMAAALPCALLGALALLLLTRALAPWTGYGPAALSAMAIGASPLWVGHVYDAEVWGPLMAGAALFVGMAVRTADPDHRLPAPHFLPDPLRGLSALPDPLRGDLLGPLMLGLVLGLGVAHHLTFVLLTPLAIGAAWPSAPHRARDPIAIAKAGALGLFGSAIGLSLYLTLMIGDADPAATGWRWGDMSTWSGWLHHITRGDYGTTELSHHDAQVSGVAQLARSLGAIGSALGGTVLAGRPLTTLALLALLTLGALGTAQRPGPLRRAPLRLRAAWLATLALTSFGFPLLFDLDPASPFAAWILERFDLLPSLLWAGTAAMALATLLTMIDVRPALLALAGVAWVSLSAASGWPRRPAADDHVQRYAQAVIASAKAEGGKSTRSYVLGTDDHRSFPILFAQEVLQATPPQERQVVYIDPALMRYAWYVERITTRYPEVPPIPQPAKLVTALQALPSTPDVYLANIMSRQASQLPTVPHGAVMRVLRPQELTQPDTTRWARQHAEALRRAGVSPSEIAEHFASGQSFDSPWANDVWGQVLELDARMRQMSGG